MMSLVLPSYRLVSLYTHSIAGYLENYKKYT